MSVYYPSNCDDLIPDHICDPCEELEGGGVRSIAYYKSDFSFTDPSNPVEWQNGFASGDIILIPQTKGTFDGGAEVESPGYGDQVTRLTGYNFQLQYQDPNYKQNCAFYNALKNSRQYKAAYRTATQIHIIDATVQVIPKNPVQEDKTTEVVWDVIVKWSGQSLPCPYDVPPGIFDACTYIT
jgi:hypothetical protein